MNRKPSYIHIMLCMNCGKDLGQGIGLCDECKAGRASRQQPPTSTEPVSDYQPQTNSTAFLDIHKVQELLPYIFLAGALAVAFATALFLLTSGSGFGSSNLTIPPPSNKAITKIANGCRKKVRDEPEVCDQLEVVCARTDAAGRKLCRTFEMKVQDLRAAGWSTHKTPHILTARQVEFETRQSGYLPQRVSDLQTLTNVSALDARTVEFTYTVHNGRKSLSEDALSSIKKEHLKSSCAPGEQLNGLKSGLRSLHTYVDGENGNTLGRVLIELSDCS